MRAHFIRPPHQPIRRLMTAQIVTSATRLGYTGSEKLTDFSTVSIFWPYGVAGGASLSSLEAK
jgi:predicted nicotinamide N-methyase